jgi:hypothetical protein
MKRLLCRWRALLGWTILVGYIGWNAYWWCRGRLAPSILRALTGIPAPTTGGTRALRALAQGDWDESLRCNPFALPIAILFVLSAAIPVSQLFRGRKPQLSRPWLFAWAVLLAAAWVAKLLGDPAYW